MAEHSSEHHIVPLKYYFGVFGLLMVLTAVTVLVASFDLEHIWGPLNIIVAMTVAVIKATAVVLIFMHVRWSSKLTQVIIISGLFWLLILLVMGVTDYMARTGWPTKLGQ
ncbi:MAG: cytochrome C oxidase subunit IV family protein [Acidobacteria bacterium]|jgi:cytochrome c oxidase subunit 4|nr:cytochrome C oxidase subunit IV family protein [Acidobacteriota bacterium]